MIKNFISKDVCKNCKYYNTPNNPQGWCQSKKVCNNGRGKVSWIDRHFCEPYKGERKMINMCFNPSQCPTCDERENCAHPLNEDVRKAKENKNDNNKM